MRFATNGKFFLGAGSLLAATRREPAKFDFGGSIFAGGGDINSSKVTSCEDIRDFVKKNTNLALRQLQCLFPSTTFPTLRVFKRRIPNPAPGPAGPSVRPPNYQRSPIGDALEWVARIMAVAMVMVLPGLAGQWLDRQYGAKFLGLLGFALGVTCGIGALLMIVRRPRS